MDKQAKQTPLVELLDAVPEDIRIGTQDSEDWNAGTTWHPVGRLCHEAAAELRRLHEENEKLRARGAADLLEISHLVVQRNELLEALKFVIRGVPDTWEGVKKACAAIAKAEGEQT